MYRAERARPRVKAQKARVFLCFLQGKITDQEDWVVALSFLPDFHFPIRRQAAILRIVPKNEQYKQGKNKSHQDGQEDPGTPPFEPFNDLVQYLGGHWKPKGRKDSQYGIGQSLFSC